MFADRERGEHTVPAGEQHHAASGDFVRWRVGHVAAVEHHRAVRRLDESADRLQQRRLAGAVRPEQRDDLTFVDFEVDVEQHLHAVVVHVDVAHEQQLHFAGLALQHDLGLRRGRRPHAIDVVAHVHRSRCQHPCADEEDRHDDEQPLAQSVLIGDAADDVERGEAGHDEQRGHREAHRSDLGRDRKRQRGVDTGHEQRGERP